MIEVEDWMAKNNWEMMSAMKITPGIQGEIDN